MSQTPANLNPQAHGPALYPPETFHDGAPPWASPAPSLLRTGARPLLLLVLLVATATAALLLLLLPLAVLQHLLVYPPELDMPSCAVRLSPALLTLDPFLLLVATSITIALLPLGISLRAHVTESGGLHARRTHTDLAPHVLVDQALSAAQLLMPLLSGCCGCSSGPLPCEKSHDAKAPRSPIRKTARVAPPRVVTASAWGRLESLESPEAELRQKRPPRPAHTWTVPDIHPNRRRIRGSRARPHTYTYVYVCIVWMCACSCATTSRRTKSLDLLSKVCTLGSVTR
jgi:hypothetical protein